MYGNVIRENKGVHQPTSTIYEFKHRGRSGVKKKKTPVWHFIQRWWKPNRNRSGWLGTGEGFQDKAAIKNWWLFATNTVAPESFMVCVMEKYEERMTQESLYPGKLPWKNRARTPPSPSKQPLTNMSVSIVCPAFGRPDQWERGLTALYKEKGLDQDGLELLLSGTKAV